MSKNLYQKKGEGKKQTHTWDSNLRQYRNKVMKGPRKDLNAVIIILYDYILCNNNVYISVIYTVSINSVYKFPCQKKSFVYMVT